MLTPLFNDAIKYHINPTGKFVIGGPHGTRTYRKKNHC
jgi:S-adenosylmethionine synthetase